MYQNVLYPKKTLCWLTLTLRSAMYMYTYIQLYIITYMYVSTRIFIYIHIYVYPYMYTALKILSPACHDSLACPTATFAALNKSVGLAVKQSSFSRIDISVCIQVLPRSDPGILER